MTLDPAITTALSLALAGLFGASAAHKIRTRREFVGVVRNYKVAPGWASAPAAALVIIVETAIAAMLVFPEARGSGALAAAGLLVAYGALISVNILRGRSEIDCGCSFGSRTERLSSVLFVRNGVLAVAALIAAAPASGRALGVYDFTVIAMFVATATAFYLSFEALRANWARFQSMGHA